MQYLAIDDVVTFDNACTNHKYRDAWVDKVKDVIFIVGMDFNGCRGE